MVWHLDIKPLMIKIKMTISRPIFKLVFFQTLNLAAFRAVSAFRRFSSVCSFSKLAFLRIFFITVYKKWSPAHFSVYSPSPPTHKVGPFFSFLFYFIIYLGFIDHEMDFKTNVFFLYKIVKFLYFCKKLSVNLYFKIWIWTIFCVTPISPKK